MTLTETKVNPEKLFFQFKPMLEKFAYKASRNYNVEIDELKSEAYLIFCETIQKHDPDKAKFSTYLFHSLRKLESHAEQMKFYDRNGFSCSVRLVKNHRNEYVRITDPEFNLETVPDNNYEKFNNAMDKLENALELSEDAQEILDMVLSFEWNIPGVHRLPRYHSVKKYYKYWKGWNYERTWKAWNEIGSFWNENYKQIALV